MNSILIFTLSMGNVYIFNQRFQEKFFVNGIVVLLINHKYQILETKQKEIITISFLVC